MVLIFGKPKFFLVPSTQLALQGMFFQGWSSKEAPASTHSTTGSTSPVMQIYGYTLDHPYYG